jgi:hypothetical protein
MNFFYWDQFEVFLSLNCFPICSEVFLHGYKEENMEGFNKEKVYKSFKVIKYLLNGGKYITIHVPIIL